MASTPLFIVVSAVGPMRLYYFYQ